MALVVSPTSVTLAYVCNPPPPVVNCGIPHERSNFSLSLNSGFVVRSGGHCMCSVLRSLPKWALVTPSYVSCFGNEAHWCRSLCSLISKYLLISRQFVVGESLKMLRSEVRRILRQRSWGCDAVWFSTGVAEAPATYVLVFTQKVTAADSWKMLGPVCHTTRRHSDTNCVLLRADHM
jgi:hypothetical protein